MRSWSFVVRKLQKERTKLWIQVEVVLRYTNSKRIVWRYEVTWMLELKNSNVYPMISSLWSRKVKWPNFCCCCCLFFVMWAILKVSAVGFIWSLVKQNNIQCVYVLWTRFLSSLELPVLMKLLVTCKSMTLPFYDKRTDIQSITAFTAWSKVREIYLLRKKKWEREKIEH